ncbi:unnamed protein product [Lathyrus oleraceus]|nr:paired amphipathic helix protein Sin3-like 6 [Pisum sativum]
MGGTGAKKPTVDFDYALEYVIKVKTRFDRPYHHHVYPLFLDILDSFKENEKSLDDVIKEVNLLFKGHDDLIDEFTNFLP